MRIAGITIPDNKRLEIGLTAVYGIGRPRAQAILDEAGIDYALRPTALTPDQENAIRKQIEAFKTEGDLKREIAGNVKRLKDIKSYRGSRHAKHLPARGRSEEHTSELQSPDHLVCRLLLEKKKKTNTQTLHRASAMSAL